MKPSEIVTETDWQLKPYTMGRAIFAAVHPDARESLLSLDDEVDDPIADLLERSIGEVLSP